MALILATTLPSDIAMATAYHKINSYRGGPAGSYSEVILAVYKDAAARQADKEPVTYKKVSVAVDLDASGNIYQNLYAAVKAHEDYAGSADSI